MTDKPGNSGRRDKPDTRDDRLKAALRANIARRKAQVRGRRALERSAGSRSGNDDNDNTD